MTAANAGIHRVIFFIAFSATGFILGREVDLHVLSPHIASTLWQNIARILSPVVGTLTGLGLAPSAQALFEAQLRSVDEASRKVAPFEVIGATVGLSGGLVIALLIRGLFSTYVNAVGLSADALLVLAALIFCVFATYVGIRVGARLRQDLIAATASSSLLVLDTSAIIDGRILDIARTGFLEGECIVPRFVLAELQAIADSSDPLRRVRGRRGLELLESLRAELHLRVAGDLEENGMAVDARLVHLARESKARLVTTDFNLNRVARIEGVKVLNVNDLAQAMRPGLIAGQAFALAITREGREADQGVGYLDDGTMIVVEGGRAHIGEEVAVVVSSVLQTSAGRMVFARMQ